MCLEKEVPPVILPLEVRSWLQVLARPPKAEQPNHYVFSLCSPATMVYLQLLANLKLVTPWPLGV